jgi:hypothetical protein
MSAVMSPPAAISSLPTLDAGPILNEKAPIVVNVTSIPDTAVENEPTSSTSPIQPKSTTEFEIEDHPIDVPPKIRVSPNHFLTLSPLTNHRLQ